MRSEPKIDDVDPSGVLEKAAFTHVRHEAEGQAIVVRFRGTEFLLLSSGENALVFRNGQV